jgi:hypothetical protein
MGIETAIIGGAIISGVAGMAAGNKAAKSQDRAAQLGIDEQRRQYDTTRADYAPYREAGYAAQKRQNYLLGLGDPYAELGPEPTRQQFTTTTPGTSPGRYVQPAAGLSAVWQGGAGTPSVTKFDEKAFTDALTAYNERKATFGQDGAYGSLMRNFTGKDLESEPGYEFQRTQGQNALNQAAIQRGGYFSGNALKELSRYNTDFAGTKYNEAFNRDAANKSRQYNFLSGPINSGIGATQGTAQAGQVASGAITDLYGQQGNAAAANYMNMGNQVGNMANSIGTGMIVGNYLNTPTTGSGNITRVSGTGSPTRYSYPSH